MWSIAIAARILQILARKDSRYTSMRLALTLGGTDCGRSGIGVYTRAIIPRLRVALESSGDELLVLGTPKEFHSYEDVLDKSRRVILTSALTAPSVNALFHLISAGPRLARAGASVLLLPAASRRIVAHSPIPTVAVVHDLAQLHVARKYDFLRMTYFNQAILPAIRRASRVVAISQSTRNDIACAFNWPLERIAVVPNGVDAARFAPPGPNDGRVRTARERLKIHSPYILYLGRLEHPGKNHVRLIEAFATSRIAEHHSLVLAGADWGAYARIRETVARLRIEHRVHMAGFVADEIIPGLVAGADSLAMVGLHEGFGLPAVEALAAGRPLFVSNTGALTEVTGDLAAPCDPLDCASIQRALEKTIADANFRKRASTEGPQFARRYDWDSTAQSLLSICRQAAQDATN
jgi:glycosyltransferase involved in cell wall biosynthesis